METEDILMCPGPNEIADRVLRAMIRPAACPVFEEFQVFYEQTLDMLAQVFQTTNQVIPLPGSGRSGLEGAITSVLERGERTLTIANGQFGELAMRIVNGLGGKAEAFQAPWGGGIDLQAFTEKLSSGTYKLVTMVHNETSTGCVYQAADISRLAHDHGALFLLDGVSSLGGANMPTDAWDVDLAVSCNHKAIGAPIGHAYVAVSDRAWEVMEKRQEPCGTLFGNLWTWKAQLEDAPHGGKVLRRPQGVFSAVHTFYALHEALSMILEEGLPARFARHLLNAAAFRAGITALGLHTIARSEDIASPTVTCVSLPAGLHSQTFLQHFRQDHGIATLPGIGDYRATAVRVGHMGVTATPRNILHALHAFDSVLTRLGHKHDRGAAVARAEEVYAAAEEDAAR
ncbi:MAG: alanine--glyoxylate aminotransferase family protein [Candidatus Tectimicrobiota bacterium]